MIRRMRAVLLIVCLIGLMIPASNRAQAQPTAPSLTVTPASAAPGDWVQVLGSGFAQSANVIGRLNWNTTSIDVAAMALSPEGADGTFAFNVQIPPTTAPGTPFFYVRAGAAGFAQVNINVVASTRKIALVASGLNPSSNTAFVNLLNSNGLPTTLIPVSSITASTNFNTYDEVLIAPDTVPQTGTTPWGTPAAQTALSKYYKPILGIGRAGYYYFGSKSLYIGSPNGASNMALGILQTAPNAPIYHTPYTVPSLNGVTTLFTTPSPTAELYYPQNAGLFFEYAQTDNASLSFYSIMQQGRYFLWGFDHAPDEMTPDGQHMFVNTVYYLLNILKRDTLVVTNLNRMLTASAGTGYSTADMGNLDVRLTTLVGKPSAQTNMNAAWVDLASDAPASLAPIYTGWEANMGAVNWTDTLANNIDSYLENLKHAVYPNLKYFILVGTHEIIPMYARAADNADETSWVLPASGYLAALYHSTYLNAKGYYLTDSIYSDLSYTSDGWGVDSTLMPEMSVGRLVQSPNQISGQIDNYLASNGTMSRINMASIASDDYMDGATSAANSMGPSADTSLIKDGFLSSLVPPLLSAKHGVVYIGGHGDYNWMTDRKWDQGFMAGPNATQGDTEEISASLANAVIAAAGCHNGVVFPNLTYLKYDGTSATTGFPDRLAEKGAGVYTASTGYTWVSISGSSKSTTYTVYSEKMAALFIQHLLNDGNTTAGKAYQSAVKQYLNDRGVGNLDGGDRRAVAPYTFFGIPNYRFPSFVISPIFKQAGYSLFFNQLQPASPAINALQSAATLTLDVKDYKVNGDGTVTIPGADYAGDSTHPLLPVVSTQITLPGAVSTVGLVLDAANSKSVTLVNDVPAVHAGTFTGNGTVIEQPVNMTFSGYYPANSGLVYSTNSNPLGSSATELNFGVIPVQYDKDTHTTRIWTHLVFNVTYNYTANSELTSADNDSDGLPNWWETAHELDPDLMTGIHGASGDPDQDGLTNLQEYQRGTDPMNPDSDCDGFSDSVEVFYATNPLNPGSTPTTIFLPILLK